MTRPTRPRGDAAEGDFASISRYACPARTSQSRALLHGHSYSPTSPPLEQRRSVSSIQLLRYGGHCCGCDSAPETAGVGSPPHSSTAHRRCAADAAPDARAVRHELAEHRRSMRTASGSRHACADANVLQPGVLARAAGRVADIRALYTAVTVSSIFSSR